MRRRVHQCTMLPRLLSTSRIRAGRRLEHTGGGLGQGRFRALRSSSRWGDPMAFLEAFAACAGLPNQAANASKKARGSLSHGSKKHYLFISQRHDFFRRPPKIMPEHLHYIWICEKSCRSTCIIFGCEEIMPLEPARLACERNHAAWAGQAGLRKEIMPLEPAGQLRKENHAAWILGRIPCLGAPST